ncbi:MAG TPA: glycosyltransferase family 2 protein [Terriglobales bacterium]|nr:glycosyltransferase family 2 protein [Terriglobales bacterium]
MTWVFWGATAFIIYVYAGYPCWLWIRSHVRPHSVRRGSYLPRVSIVLVARNEEGVIAEKLRNLLELNYPPESYDVVVVSDGSTDRTVEVVKEFTGSGRVRVVEKEVSRGKAAGLNDAMASASGEIVVFNDARQYIEPDAVRLLLENFADPEVGCASGELMLGDPRQGEAIKGMGLYWRIEKNVRELESRSGSVVGATGALYAVRRNLLVSVPSDTILDDVYIPMHVVKSGARVVFEPRARAWDIADLGAEREFARKVRTLSGNYQLLQLAPWLLGSSNPLRFEFVSHKLLRLLVPFALAAALLSSLALAQPIYRLALVAQIAFYALGLLAMARWLSGPLARIADAALTFVVLNTAAAVAFANFVTGRKAAWNR